MTRDFDQLADAWARDDRSVLDALEPAERRAIGLVAAGVTLDGHAELDQAFVRGLKGSTLTRLGVSTAGPILEAKADLPDNVIRWVYSDESVDRAGDIIRQNWELGPYKQNPVILWGHGRAFDSEADIPIGRSVRVVVEGKRLVGDIEFAVAESERAARIHRLARGGFIKAGSVGFRPLKTTHVEDPGERERLGLGRWGAVYEKSELLEFSPCAVPCNPNALQASVKAGAMQERDADFLAAWQDPTEREWEKLMRKRARAWVALSSGAAAKGDASSGTSDDDESGGGTASILRALTSTLNDLREACEDDAASRRMLARSITDLGARLGVPRAVDSARSGTDAEIKSAADYMARLKL